MNLALVINLISFTNRLFGGFDNAGKFFQEVGSLIGGKSGIDLFDNLDDAGLFDAASDFNLLDGLSDLFKDAYDGAETFFNSDFVEDLIGQPIFSGSDGNDLLTAAIEGDSLLVGAAGDDTLLGQLGNDILSGGDGRDLLKGRVGNDVLTGLTGSDILSGGNGNDLLTGGKGFDLLTGGGGKDIFVLQAQSGQDTIADFKLGRDQLSLLGDILFEDVAIVSKGTGTQLALNGKSIAFLKGIAADQITATDFRTLTASDLTNGLSG